MRENRVHTSGNARSRVIIPNDRHMMPVFIASGIVSGLMLGLSLAGILWGRDIYTTQETLESFVTNDVVNICIGLPILLVSMFMARRGAFAGPLLWLGALVYVAYNYTVYALALSGGWLYLQYPVIVLLSIASAIVLYRNIDGSVVMDRLRGRVPERFSAGILVLFGTAFAGLAAYNLVAIRPQGLDLALNITDAAFSPLWAVCGVLLWLRRGSGFVMGLGMLFQASMLFIGLIGFMMVQPIITAVSISWEDVVVVFVMGFVCFIPFGLFLRGAQGLRKTSFSINEELHYVEQ